MIATIASMRLLSSLMPNDCFCACALVTVQEDSKATRERATDYLKIHGTVLAAGLNEWY